MWIYFPHRAEIGTGKKLKKTLGRHQPHSSLAHSVIMHALQFGVGLASSEISICLIYWENREHFGSLSTRICLTNHPRASRLGLDQIGQVAAAYSGLIRQSVFCGDTG